MGQRDSEGKGIDFQELAEASDELREMFRALVAGLIDDGFTDEQARAMVAGVFASGYKRQENES